MSEEGVAVLDSSPSSSKKKTWRKIPSGKPAAKQDQNPKESIKEINGHYFLTTEDDPNAIQDHFCAYLEAIGRNIHRKAEGS